MLDAFGSSFGVGMELEHQAGGPASVEADGRACQETALLEPADALEQV